jgi:hypothetical protein
MPNLANILGHYSFYDLVYMHNISATSAYACIAYDDKNILPNNKAKKNSGMAALGMNPEY